MTEDEEFSERRKRFLESEALPRLRYSTPQVSPTVELSHKFIESLAPHTDQILYELYAKCLEHSTVRSKNEKYGTRYKGCVIELHKDTGYPLKITSILMVDPQEG